MTAGSHSPRYLTRVDQLEHLNSREKAALGRITERFAFRSNEYYLSLILWDDPQDPIRRVVVPVAEELDTWGNPDPSGEVAYTVVPGLEHKYRSTVLLLVSGVCEGICRYCFRKRIFNQPGAECLRDPSAAIRYLREHREVTDVLLSGGDPLSLSTPKLADLLGRLREIEHIRTIRISTKTPAFNPYRILEDPDFPGMIRQCRADRRRLYIMTHFVHPRELTDAAIQAVDLLQTAGAVASNQMPLIRGVNDHPDVLAELWTQLSSIGDVPYYILQCRPTLGNRPYVVPIEQGWRIVEEAKSRVSGLAKRLRYMMSHASGKIEIIGRIGRQMCFRYHQAVQSSNQGRFLLFESRPDACWLEDYDAEFCDDPHPASPCSAARTGGDRR